MAKVLLKKAYEPHEAEERWARLWEENRLFEASVGSRAESYCIVIPPPNVTGSLHMGHALNVTLQDIMCRFKRMSGHNVLWLPGTDHAGIATQNVVERELTSQNIDRHELGRDAFIERVWQWKERYGGFIIEQLKKIGASCDWSRERFTMDGGLSRAVKEVFVRLHKEGLIYRGNYIINWCPRCRTALADLEVEHRTHDGFLYYIRYPLEESDEFVTVATTRPETMLGDTAVAVNPNDPRHRNLEGKTVILPFIGRKLPLIFDDYVDVEFGTGVLKITPAHDVNDFEIGSRQKLEAVKVMDEDGRMNDLAGEYNGLDRFECREKIVEDLKKNGLLEKIEPYSHSVGHCYRCETMVEPMLSKQWFVKVKPLADPACEAVKEGHTRIIPKGWEKTYFEWMYNIKDWCISRQIWWGHRIPAWYCNTCGEVIVEATEPRVCSNCRNSDLTQDPDVLDTWFSSALWPFSTLGWPEDTPELRRFYPTSVLITGFDILFFWVARMMMMGLHFMRDIPFRDVYIHALIRDVEGRKMSKSLGNVIDPLEVTRDYGADALRFTLAALAVQGRDIRLSYERIEGYRHFINKIWNASRFTLMNLEDYTHREMEPDNPVLTFAHRWILSRLQQVISDINDHLETYDFSQAANLIYQFFWHEFCDWYLEMIKPALYGKEGHEKREIAQCVVVEALQILLRLLHPFTPFVTEEIWEKLPLAKGFITLSSFPKRDPIWEDKEAESEMNVITGVIVGIRNIRSEMNVPPATLVDGIVFSKNSKSCKALENNRDHIVNLAHLSHLAINPESRPRGAASILFGDIEIFVPLKGVIRFDQEERRLNKLIETVNRQYKLATEKLSQEDFVNRAPGEIVEKERVRVQELSERLEKLKSNLERIREMKEELSQQETS
jgi:valyl-tRNA synthetase